MAVAPREGSSFACVGYGSITKVILIQLDLEGGEESKLMTWESTCSKLKKKSLFENAHNFWHKDCMYKEMHISGNVVHVY